MKNQLGRLFLFIPFFLIIASCSRIYETTHGEGVVIENPEFSLAIGNDGTALSLKHKPTGQECLKKGINEPMFSITQYRPYQNELFLSMPTKATTYYADSVYMDGDDLVVSFEKVLYKVTIDLKITDSYIGFKLKSLEQRFGETLDRDKEAEANVDEFTLLQLPVKKRKYFGNWLNVAWDNDIAVNILATDPYCKVDADSEDGYHLMKAGMEKQVKLFDVGAALITTSKDKLFDCIDQLEVDYNLPRGVESRRSEAYKYSYYEVYDVNPQNIDEHIAFAKQGGFNAFLIYYVAFSNAMGHFPWRPEYPNGMEDLKLIVKKIEEAGMIPGFHIHYNKAMKHDKYITPVPDPRIHLTRMFTLAKPVSIEDTVIFIEENPESSTLADGRRILKIGNELIEYASYTTTPPYRFTGCKRGDLNTRVSGYSKGFKFGLVNVDSWTIFIRFDQNTSIRKELSQRVAGIYKDAGFKFVYFDGAEDVHPPYWFHVGNSQYEVYKHLEPKPLFSEGAAKAHFSWHILSRGNAFDVYPAEKIKRFVDLNMVQEAKSIVGDLTSINFGWNNYTAPSEETIGMQPDMYEYVNCRATAWGCPISLIANFDHLKAHPRTPDNLAVMRRWEQARLQNFFTEKQKEEMKNLDQEYTLLVNEEGNFELHPYWQISGLPLDSSKIRAYVFERNKKTYIAYWHSSGKGKITLKMDAPKLKLFKEIGNEAPFQVEDEKIILPIAGCRYLQIDLDREEAVTAFKEAKLLGDPI